MVERIPPYLSFLNDEVQICPDGSKWRSMLCESNELRMMTVAFGQSGQNSLGKKSLSPQRDQALRIEVLRMNRPKSHLMSRAA